MSDVAFRRRRKAGENFNRRYTLSISRIELKLHFVQNVKPNAGIGQKGTFSIKSGPRLDISNPFFNILFFGDFVRLEYDEYEAAMEDVLNGHTLTYRAQVRELYTLGTFLATKKYRFVRLAYMSFISGLFASGSVLALISQ